MKNAWTPSSGSFAVCVHCKKYFVKKLQCNDNVKTTFRYYYFKKGYFNINLVNNHLFKNI